MTDFCCYATKFCTGLFEVERAQLPVGPPEHFHRRRQPSRARRPVARLGFSDAGHPQVQIRAGIHTGPMRVEEGDVFGGTVNFAARVVGAVKDAEIWLSDRAKEVIDRLGAGKHKYLKWERHEGVGMEGFPGMGGGRVIATVPSAGPRGTSHHDSVLGNRPPVPGDELLLAA